uniref:CDC42 small effector protein 2-A n=1 Tax=Lepeophtheirus salmonis TaxID=72036 RepID=D3PGH3_LEPSM|nr:CDC42 small effector protein 2-A-like [Lepeophtheirus salmonis]ADD24369.1 CDC42 small effector protein 2-A [Lepeophtheirus salmonis]ADD38356.1 CDC42 small effector protein 2-A [Lepeophtheirus salmonis]
MSEVWIQMFRCCATQEVPSSSRRRIDRSMIGNPTDFRHTAHIGTNDLDSQEEDPHNRSTDYLTHQMNSKGGYGPDQKVQIRVPHIVNARSLDEIRRK